MVPNLATQPAFAGRPHRAAGPPRVASFLALQGLSLTVPPSGAQADVATIVETVHSVARDLRYGSRNRISHSIASFTDSGVGV